MVIHLRKKHVLWLALLLFLSFCAYCFAGAYSETDKGEVESIRLPVVMYHHVMPNDKNSGDYVVSAQTLEKDLKYIKSAGYTTVDVADIDAYVNGDGTLPEKCVMLTFDDGFESLQTIVEPLLEKYGMCAVGAVIGAIVEEYTERDEHGLPYSYLTADAIKQLMSGDTVEIQNHSYNMHQSAKGKRKGMGRISGENEKEYVAAVKADLLKCQEYLSALGEAPTTVVYPYGVHNKLLDSLVDEMDFVSSFVCEERINTLVQGEPESLMQLGRYNRPSGKSADAFLAPLLETEN